MSGPKRTAASRAWEVQMIRGMVLDHMGKKHLQMMALLNKEGSDMALQSMYREVDEKHVAKALKVTNDARRYTLYCNSVRTLRTRVTTPLHGGDIGRYIIQYPHVHEIVAPATGQHYLFPDGASATGRIVVYTRSDLTMGTDMKYTLQSQDDSGLKWAGPIEERCDLTVFEPGNGGTAQCIAALSDYIHGAWSLDASKSTNISSRIRVRRLASLNVHPPINAEDLLRLTGFMQSAYGALRRDAHLHAGLDLFSARLVQKDGIVAYSLTIQVYDANVTLDELTPYHVRHLTHLHLRSWFCDRTSEVGPKPFQRSAPWEPLQSIWEWRDEPANASVDRPDDSPDGASDNRQLKSIGIELNSDADSSPNVLEWGAQILRIGGPLCKPTVILTDDNHEVDSTASRIVTQGVRDVMAGLIERVRAGRPPGWARIEKDTQDGANQ